MTKLEQQLDKALAVLVSHKKPVRYIVRPARPRPAGKGRKPAVHSAERALFPAGYVVTRPRDPRTGTVLWDVTAPNGEWVGEFPLRRSALLMAQRHNQRAGFSKLRKRRGGKGRRPSGYPAHAKYHVGDQVEFRIRGYPNGTGVVEESPEPTQYQRGPIQYWVRFFNGEYGWLSESRIVRKSSYGGKARRSGKGGGKQRAYARIPAGVRVARDGTVRYKGKLLGSVVDEYDGTYYAVDADDRVLSTNRWVLKSDAVRELLKKHRVKMVVR